ncbi:MAG: M20 family metallopeptidase [Immundisolibacterales bacterium]|nr:M20 family metallopeptidase [Immundisolibacterales bacterium]
MNLIDDIVSRHDELTEIRRDLHRHPELAYEEHRTADLVAERLTQWGIPIRRGLGRTGVVGTLKCGHGNRAIGLRADMDALAMNELNTFEHASRHPGRMHGCGHDGHTTMLLGAARHLAEHQGFDGTVHFIFQPAEEGAGGADEMIRDGLFEEFPVDSVWGMHNYPTVPVGKFITRAGPFLASSDTVRVTVNGVGGHGAMPHLARSPVNAACAIIEALNDFVAQEINAQNAATFTVGRIRGGDAINVIPDSVEFAGTVRSFTHSVREQFATGLERIVDGICAARGIGADAVYEKNYPPLVNSEEETAIAARAAAKVVGAENVDAAAGRVMGSEDFAFMLLQRPGNYIMVGNGAGELGSCMVHNPHYDFNDEILPIGATYWVELTRELLPSH